jgi:quinol monooxygenase YgiN
MAPSAADHRYRARMTSQVGVLAKISVQDGKADEAITALQAMLDHVLTEAGTQTYILHRDQADPNVLWVYELYADQASFEAHSSSDTMKGLGRSLGPMLAGLPELTMLTPVGGKGV